MNYPIDILIIYLGSCKCILILGVVLLVSIATINVLKMDVNPESTDRLQIESQRMEERLKMLKQMMSVEKSQRE